MSRLFRSGHDHYLNALRHELMGMEQVLELGCGGHSPLTQFESDFALDGVDLFEPALETARQTRRYRALYRQDVTALDFADKCYDAVCGLDLIEHLPRDKGEQLLEQMLRIARRKVILFTPNGFLQQKSYEDNLWQVHRSGWTTADFRRRGFRVSGMNGLKFLRGELAEIRWKPVSFWRRISDLSERLVKPLPGFAFQILAVKEIGETHD